MGEQASRRDSREHRGKPVADGMLAGAERAMGDAGDRMLKQAPRRIRLVAKTVPLMPGLLADGVEIATGKDMTREIVGAIGGFVGGAAGGALGLATGPAAPVAAPLGAAVGSVGGEHVAEDIYDRNKAALDRRVEALRRGAGTAVNWVKARNEQVARGVMNDLQRDVYLPGYGRRF